MPPKHVQRAALPSMLHSENANCSPDQKDGKDSLDPDRQTMISFR
jgi:hypothetical protein